MTPPNDTTNAADDLLDDDFESIGEYHRMAAHHFTAAAKHHLAAAEAHNDGEAESSARHALLAYRHQLAGTQYAEVAVMEGDSLDDEFAQLEDEEVAVDET